VEPPTVVDPAAARIAAIMEASLDSMVSPAVQAIWDQVPVYSGSGDERLAGHVRPIFWVFLAGLTAGRPARWSDFAMTREQATRRVVQGITLVDSCRRFGAGSSRCRTASWRRPVTTPRSVEFQNGT